ncbi:MAG: hypothetical protein Q4F66_05325 [Clostridium sp.]|nr:hypothetical protein [Clostridium sp.]
MMITGLSNNYGINTGTTKIKDSSSIKTEDKDKKSSGGILEKDTFEKSVPEEKITYTRQEVENKANSVKKSDTEEVNRLIEESERKQEEFKQLIRSLIAKQGESYNLTLFGQKLNVTPEAAEKAKKSIEDGGEYSVDSVATNIMNMAKALSNGDSSKIGELRDSFLKGFKEAEKAWGGELPDISQKTYDEVLKRFDEWENSSKEETTKEQ